MWIPAHVTQFGWLVVIDVPAGPNRTAAYPIGPSPPRWRGSAEQSQTGRTRLQRLLRRVCMRAGVIHSDTCRPAALAFAGRDGSDAAARTPASLAVARMHAPTVNSSLRCHAMRNSRRISSPSAVSGRYAVRLHRWLRSHYGRCDPTCAEERRMPTKLVGPSTLGPDPRWSAWAGPCQAGLGSALH